MDCNNQQDSPAIFTDGKGQYIERLSEQHDTVSFSPQGGGPVYELPRATFYERYHIAAPAQFKWVKVRGDWMDEAAAIAAAWHQLRWNGWVMPYFRFEDVKQLCELVPNLTYDEAADAVWLRVPEEERGGYYDDECYPATLIEVDGQQVKAYSVGAGSWCWEIADWSVAPINPFPCSHRLHSSHGRHPPGGAGLPFGIHHMTYTIFAVRHDGTPVEVHHPTLGHCLAWMNWRESVDHQVVLAADAPFQLWHGRELLTNRCRRQCSSLAPVLSGLSEPLEVLQQMIDELRPLAAHPSEAARVLLPEQMPVSLWEAISTIRSVAFGVIPCFDSHGYALTHPMEKAFSAAFGYGSSGPAYDGEGQCNARHAVHVAHALASGRWVPTEALQHYVDHGMPTDLAWASDLVHKPYLRGAFRSVDECSIVLTLLAQAGVHLDEASARKLVADLAAHNRYAVSNFVEGDNALYEAGWLSVRPLPVDKGQQVPPRSPLAEAVHREVLAENLKNGLRALEEERGRMSTREYLFRKGLLERAAASSDASWANRVADTVLTRNLAGMLSILDNSHNVASQRACEQHFGIKLRGLHARARRLAVFKLAGIEGARAVAEAESNLDAADAAAKLQKRLEVSRKRLENHVVRNGAETYTGDEWVRHLMASGYTKLVERKTGASVRYFLVDHEGSGWALSVARGFYDYAVLCLDALEAAKTVPQPSA